VKTRLAPLLGERRAAELASAFIRDTLAAVGAVARRLRADPHLFYDPPSAATEMQGLAGREVELHAQAGGNLSRRLDAARRSLSAAGYAHLCFLGADSPTLPQAYVERACAQLDAGTDVVIGPASDGGYYLIALRAAQSGLFERIEWSTCRVLAQTVARSDQLGLRRALLPEWYDVDDAASLRRLRDEMAAAQHGIDGAMAAHTRAVLERLTDVAW